jgi:endonuclease G, mitochondrial
MKLILLLASLLSLEALGHGGGLDANGGHYNRSTAEYHCHQEPCFSNQQNQIDETESDAPLLHLEGISDGAICNGILPFGAPNKADYLLCRSAYSAGMDCSNRSAAWVAYTVSPDISDSANVERSNNFRSDTELPKECRKELFDFSGSYDRGHLASSETLDGNYTMNSETFLLSNMSPQLSGFNRAIWKGLENRERKWANERGKLHVITGPVFVAKLAKKMMGRVPVPSHFYKILFDPTKRQSLSFLIPHRALKTASLGKFRTSIDQIEKVTGIDFFAGLEDKVEHRIESQVSTMW